MSARSLVIMLSLSIVLVWWRAYNMNDEIEPSYVDAHHNRRIFILAGQSNMAGRGGVENKIWDGFVPRECEPDPAILRLSAGLTWEEAREPLHSDIDSNKTCGIGPGLVFAKETLRKDPKNYLKVIGLVPCAVGGTSISEWSRGSVLYNSLIARANAAVKDGGVLEGILWYQGERDTVVLEDADSYKSKLEKLVSDLRNDLRSPKLPFIEVVLASAEGPFVENVREAQLGIDLPQVIKVDANGLPVQPDGLHLSTLAQVRLGLMMSHAFASFKAQ